MKVFHAPRSMFRDHRGFTPLHLGSGMWREVLPRISTLRKAVSYGMRKEVTGFTMIELIISISIFLMLTLLTVLNFRSFQTSASLEIEADTFASTLRQAQLWALSGQRVNTQRPLGGYGIQIIPCVSPPCSYSFFADVYPAGVPNHLYDAGQDILVNSIALPNAVVVAQTTPSYPSTIAFVPPKGEIWINGSSVSSEFVVDFRISGGTATRKVRLDRLSGRVNLE